MDGIKTGYTNASGFNILTSVKRNGHFLVSVVMGGRSGASRDRIMAGLIDQYIEDAGTTRTATAVAEAAPDEDDEAPATRKTVAAKADDEDGPVTRVNRADAATPILVAPVQVTPVQATSVQATSVQATSGRGAAMQVASIGNVVPVERPRPAFVPGTPRASAGEDTAPTATVRPIHATLDGSTAQTSARGSGSATPSSMRWVVGAQPSRARHPEAPAKLAKLETKPESKPDTRSDTRIAGKAEPQHGVETARPAPGRGGWVIQIGATDDAAKASELLARARTQSRTALVSAKPYTEKVQKGSGTLYRARFAGLEENTAETACRSLKRSGFACFATKN